SVTPPAPVIADGTPAGQGFTLAGFCPGSAITINGGAVTGITYRWYRDNGGNPELIAGENGHAYTPAGLVAGTYTFYVSAIRTNGCGGESALRQITVTVLPTPVAPAFSSPATVCGA